ncbi:MAG: BACON domain-containing protein, partial [Thermoplasmatota archaeon]
MKTRKIRVIIITISLILTMFVFGPSVLADQNLVQQTITNYSENLEFSECFAQSFKTADNQIDITKVEVYLTNPYPSGEGYCVVGISDILSANPYYWLDWEIKSFSNLNGGWTTFNNVDCDVNENSDYLLMIKIALYNYSTVDVGIGYLSTNPYGPYQDGLFMIWTLDDVWVPQFYKDLSFKIWGNTQTNNPVLSYNPDEINFGSQTQGWTGSSTFEIWNSGGQTLSYSLSENLNWITVSPTSGSSNGEHDTITVNVVNTGNMNGYYSGYIDISSNGGSGSVFVEIYVSPPQGPALSYSPKSINFGSHPKGWTGSSTFEIWNSGGQTL